MQYFMQFAPTVVAQCALNFASAPYRIIFSTIAIVSMVCSNENPVIRSFLSYHLTILVYTPQRWCNLLPKKIVSISNWTQVQDASKVLRFLVSIACSCLKSWKNQFKILFNADISLLLKSQFLMLWILLNEEFEKALVLAIK